MFKRLLISVVCLFLVLFSFAACGGDDTNGSASATPTAGTTTSSSATPTTAATSTPAEATSTSTTATATATTATSSSTPFKVTKIDMSMNPGSIANVACGAGATINYVATFHVAAATSGGTVTFTYTTNNGRSTSAGSLVFAPGETTKTYKFSWSGVVNSDNVNPGQAGILTISPNIVRSTLIKPAGTCKSMTTQFKVTAVNLTVSPASIADQACGSNITLTYTVTFRLSGNRSGGTIKFNYTTNNGHSQTPATAMAASGAEIAGTTFTISGKLTPDHTFPGTAIVMVESPNQLTSSGVKPAGVCS